MKYGEAIILYIVTTHSDKQNDYSSIVENVDKDKFLKER